MRDQCDSSSSSSCRSRNKWINMEHISDVKDSIIHEVKGKIHMF